MNADPKRAGDPLRLRSIKGVPFCWQSKAVRRAIREAFDATHNVASALAVYDALTEIASDEESETFATTHAWIQRMRSFDEEHPADSADSVRTWSCRHLDAKDARSVDVHLAPVRP